MNDILKDAKFGDLFETRCGLTAVYVGNYGGVHRLYVENAGLTHYLDGNDGMCDTSYYDIIGRYTEPEVDHNLRGWQAAFISDTLKNAATYIGIVKGRFKNDSEKANDIITRIKRCTGMLKL